MLWKEKWKPQNETTSDWHSQKPQWFKDTKTTNLPVHYYHEEGAKMGREISENCFQKMFLPGVRSLLKEKGLPQKVVLLLYNAPSHPNESATSDSGFAVKFLTPPMSHSQYSS